MLGWPSPVTPWLAGGTWPMRRGRCVSPSESCQKDLRRSHHGGAVGKQAAAVCCAAGCHAGTYTSTMSCLRAVSSIRSPQPSGTHIAPAVNRRWKPTGGGFVAHGLTRTPALVRARPHSHAKNDRAGPLLGPVPSKKDLERVSCSQDPHMQREAQHGSRETFERL